ncbi:hypothetical protein HDU67_008114 [Dinochytrium kinnereticum]|nr:hypothetical protein HDU67_008114 [Dinochytrium kinnereticum]
MTGNHSFCFYEEPLDLFFASTAMSLSEKYLVYGSDDTHTIFTRYLTDQLVVRDLASMKVLRVMGGYKLRNVCVCDDFIVTDDGTPYLRVTPIKTLEGRSAETIRKDHLRQLPDGEQQMDVATLYVGDHHTVDLIFDPVRKNLISASSSGLVSIWNLHTLLPISRLVDRPNISSICLSGNLLVTAGGGIDDQFVHFWDMKTRSRFRAIPISYHAVFQYAKMLRISPPKATHLWSVDALAVSSRTVACNFGYMGVYLVFDAFRLKWILNDTVDGSYGGLNTPKICLNDRFLFTATRSSIAMWDLTTGNLLRRLHEPRGPEVGPFRQQELVTSITSIKITPDGRRLLVSAFGGTLYEWKVSPEVDRPSTGYYELLRQSRTALEGVLGERMKFGSRRR